VPSSRAPPACSVCFEPFPSKRPGHRSTTGGGVDAGTRVAVAVDESEQSAAFSGSLLDRQAMQQSLVAPRPLLPGNGCRCLTGWRSRRRLTGWIRFVAGVSSARRGPLLLLVRAGVIGVATAFSPTQQWLSVVADCCSRGSPERRLAGSGLAPGLRGLAFARELRSGWRASRRLQNRDGRDRQVARVAGLQGCGAAGPAR
jgi:hypothetical protein